MQKNGSAIPDHGGNYGYLVVFTTKTNNFSCNAHVSMLKYQAVVSAGSAGESAADEVTLPFARLHPDSFYPAPGLGSRPIQSN